MDALTHAEKLVAYDMGLYSFQPPPVPTWEWSREDWVKWVDSDGYWHLAAEAASYCAHNTNKTVASVLEVTEFRWGRASARRGFNLFLSGGWPDVEPT